jgi:hypothetical protein
MTPSERARLHESLRAQLHLEDPSPAPVPTSSRWNRWLAPIGGLAVAAVIVGAVVILPGTFSGGDSDGSLEVALSPTTTAVAVGEAPEPASVTESGAAIPSADATGTFDSSTLSVQADDEPENAAAAPLTIPYIPVTSLEDLATSYASGLPDDLASSPSEERSGAPVDQGIACLDAVTAALPGATVRPVALTSLEDVDVLVVAVTPPDADTYLAAYSLWSCEPVSDTRG